MSYPWELPPYYRRKQGQHAGWSADKIDRYVADPLTPEFFGSRAQVLTDDELLPPDKFREWLADPDPNNAVPPFTLPVEHWFVSEPDDDDPECE